MRNEEIELWFANQLFDIVEEMETLELESSRTPREGPRKADLFVGNGAERIIGVFAFEINDKFSELVVVTKPVYSVH
jgi:hypothetical protein